jgi:hypothetical protein
MKIVTVISQISPPVELGATGQWVAGIGLAAIIALWTYFNKRESDLLTKHTAEKKEMIAEQKQALAVQEAHYRQLLAEQNDRYQKLLEKQESDCAKRISETEAILREITDIHIKQAKSTELMVTSINDNINKKFLELAAPKRRGSAGDATP